MTKSTKCSQCNKKSLHWITMRTRMPMDVLCCQSCGHQEVEEDWTPPLSPWSPGLCINCTDDTSTPICSSCGLNASESLDVHAELVQLVCPANTDLLRAAREANQQGRRVLALKLATAAAGSLEDHRKLAARAMRVWLLSAIGEHEAALTDARVWVDAEEEPSHLAWGSLGQQLEHAGKIGQACEAYEQSLFIDPSQHIMRARRATLLMQSQRDGQALHEVRIVLQDSDDTTAIGIVLVVAESLCDGFEKRGSNEGIVKILRDVGNHIDDSAHLLAHAARIAAIAGDAKNARKWLKQAKELKTDLEIYDRVREVLQPLGKQWWPW